MLQSHHVCTWLCPGFRLCISNCLSMDYGLIWMNHPTTAQGTSVWTQVSYFSGFHVLLSANYLVHKCIVKSFWIRASADTFSLGCGHINTFEFWREDVYIWSSNVSESCKWQNIWANFFGILCLHNFKSTRLSVQKKKSIFLDISCQYPRTSCCPLCWRECLGLAWNRGCWTKERFHMWATLPRWTWCFPRSFPTESNICSCWNLWSAIQVSNSRDLLPCPRLPVSDPLSSISKWRWLVMDCTVWNVVYARHILVSW